jgi:hypothetical protein
MTVPDAFNKLANAFHQDTLLINNTLDEAIQASVRSLTPAERLIVTTSNWPTYGIRALLDLEGLKSRAMPRVAPRGYRQ